MSREKLSEYSSKKIFFLNYLKNDFSSIQFNSILDNKKKLETLLDNGKRYVVKVDQGEKKRAKRGLIGINLNTQSVIAKITDLELLGFSVFIIEEFREYSSDLERYISFSREREGVRFFFNKLGGVNVEDLKENLVIEFISFSNINSLSVKYSIREDFLVALFSYFENEYLSFLEINPFVENGDEILILDMAVEVDSVALLSGVIWNEKDFYTPISNKFTEEILVKELDDISSSSLKLKVLNPNGSIFMLLSGGGASITLADEVYNLGFQNQIVNYGEYSGNPTEEETYLYTLQIISLLKKSKSTNKVLIIAGGIANFTDVQKTFKGIVKALKENEVLLKSLNLKVFVRRGGPNQKIGLKFIKDALEDIRILGGVYGPELVLTEIVSLAVKEIKI